MFGLSFKKWQQGALVAGSPTQWRRLLISVLCLTVTACHRPALSSATETSPKSLERLASYHIQLGMAYLEQGNRVRAKRKLMAALIEAPDLAQANGAMAYYLEQTGEFIEAKRHYLRAMDCSNNAGADLNNYAAFLCRRGQFTEAERYFNRVFKDKSYENSALAYENAGLCAEKAGNFSLAKQYLIRALRQDPNRRQAGLALARIAK